MNRTGIIISILLLVALGIATRLLPHEPNATALTGIAIASSLYLGKKWTIPLTLGILFVSDLFIGFYDVRIMASVYGSFAIIALIAWLARKNKTVLTAGAAVASSALSFFLITNFAVWMFSPWYEKSIAGLLYSYELGLPFLRNMFFGDVLYTAGIVVAFEAAVLLSRAYVRFQKPSTSARSASSQRG